MLFTVTYRSKTGAKAEAEIEAASRTACMDECKLRGIAPVGIREGRASLRSRAAETAAPHDGPVRSGTLWRAAILAAAVLAVVGGGLWWWLGHDEAQPNQAEAKPEPAADPQETKPSDSKLVENETNALTQTHDEAKPNTAAPQASNPAEPMPPMHMGRRIVEMSATTNADGTVVERIRTDDGKLHSKVYSVAEPVFNSGTDQLLAMAVAGDADGTPLPPATKADEQRFLESLKKPIEILETDAPDVRAIKEKVIQARADMVELLAQGRSFPEVLAEHHKMQAENAAVRREAAKELRSLVESGDTAGALEYRKRMNAAFEQMGIQPLTTAITEEERAERKERRRASRKERRGQ